MLTALIRHRTGEWNGNDTARLIDVDADQVADVVDLITDRARTVAASEETAADVRRELEARLHGLSARQARQQTGVLGYKEGNDDRVRGLLLAPSSARWDLWTCPNSLREVEPGINLLLADDRDFSLFSEPEYEYRDEADGDEATGDGQPASEAAVESG